MGMLFVIGCSEKESFLSDNLPENVETDEISQPKRTIYHYETETFEKFIEWVTSEDSKKINDGAFRKLVELYQTNNYVLFPTLSGSKFNKVFVDSNVNLINFVFTNPSIRISFEPIDVEENEEIDTTDISQFMEDKYDVEFNVEKAITDSGVKGNKAKKLKTGYEYDSHYFISKKIKIKDRTKKCVLETKSSEKSDSEHILSFIEKGMIVRIIYYDNDKKEFNFKDLETLVFEKNVLSD